MKYLVLLSVVVLSLTACRTPQTANAGSAQRELPSGAIHANGPILSYADVVQPVSAAVVTIRASRRVRAPQQFPFFDDPLFRQFFGGGMPRSQEKTELQSALGSGVIVGANGYIVTNFHVIDGAEDVKVDLNNRRTYSAKVVGSDQPSDLALLNIKAHDLPVLNLGDSDQVRVGDVCLAVGNPFGVGESVTEGIISAKGRSTDVVGSGSFEDFLQTDAAINKGNSGGALVNTRGELIGINSQILSPSQGSVGIGFAIPSNLVRNVMDQLIKKGTVRRGTLGVTVQPVTSEIAASLGLHDVRGVLVNSVRPDGAAKQAGMQEGDVILQLNGKDIVDSNELRNEIAAKAPGTQVTLTVWRNGSQRQVSVRLGELTAQALNESPATGESGDKLGVTVEPMTAALASQLGLSPKTQGLAIASVDPNGAAARAGLQEGDVIQQVNLRPVRSIADLHDALQQSANRPPLLLIDRGGQRVYLAVPLE